MSAFVIDTGAMLWSRLVLLQKLLSPQASQQAPTRCRTSKVALVDCLLCMGTALPCNVPTSWQTRQGLVIADPYRLCIH
jgi:hypothetical protein